MTTERDYNINDKLCSPQAYNFFGDLDIMIATGKITTQDATECIREIYDKDTWNIPRDDKRRRPPMYK